MASPGPTPDREIGGDPGPAMRVGILGGGQLGRMLALEGRPLGLRFRFLEPKDEPPVAELGQIVQAAYDDPDGVARFGVGLDVVTYEFENVPVASARSLARERPILPPPGALEMAQDRLVEKRGFRDLEIPTAPFAPVDDRSDLDEALERVGTPAVLKTRRFGYDGKGQAVLEGPADADAGWESLAGRGPFILEGFVEFDRELSILAVRGRDGSEAFYPLVENHHRDGILRLSLAPAPGLDPGVQSRAEGYARRVLDRLEYAGVVAIELFQVGHDLLANEMAPRVHNSGHWTLDGAVTSQFENHLRAVCGFPLGATGVRGAAAMLNLLGGVPDPARILAVPGAHLHLYEKGPRPGRKLGHVNLTAEDEEGVRESLERVEEIVGATEKLASPA